MGWAVLLDLLAADVVEVMAAAVDVAVDAVAAHLCPAAEFAVADVAAAAAEAAVAVHLSNGAGDVAAAAAAVAAAADDDAASVCL